jgi:thioredoxin-related protein
MKKRGWIILVALSLGSLLQAQSAGKVFYKQLTAQKLWQPMQKKSVILGADDRLQLLITLSPECPMCRNYTLTLKQLKQQYDSVVSITGIFPGTAYTDEEINAFYKKYDLNIEVLTDKTMSVTRLLQATVTPEVFLFDRAGNLVYSGAIDNWLTALGKKKQKPDKNYLKDAIAETLKGQQVSLNYMEANGCSINDF